MADGHLVRRKLIFPNKLTEYSRNYDAPGRFGSVNEAAELGTTFTV
jgi:hypothetical protein